MNYFNELLEINKIITNDDNNVRIENLEEVYQLLDTFNRRPFNLDEFIKLCILLFNMQIFYDGNSRTIFTYLIRKLDEYGYNINVNNAKEELIELRRLFPTIYDLNEEINDKTILRIKKYVYERK